MNDEPIFQRAPLYPASWEIVCPACGEPMEIENVTETHVGTFEPDVSDKFVQCVACHADIEIVAVRFSEVAP